MIKSLPLDFLGGSQRILEKNENAVYRLPISALVPKIFKFENYVKYANEMTDDVIYSTQFYIMYINRIGNNDARLILRKKLNGTTT